MNKILEFILPIVFASAEVMIWILLLLMLFVFGRGRLSPSERTLVIERKGQYSMELAPGLNLAQPFIEAIATHVVAQGINVSNEAELCFTISDKQLATRKQPSYLLKISSRAGLLHFETKPDMQMSKLAASGMIEDKKNRIEQVAHSVGESWGIAIRRIDQPIVAI